MDEALWRQIDRNVAARDGDRYMATFFAPSEKRRSLLALYAFDNEVSRIGLSATDRIVGHIRLAWWREQVAAIHAGEPLQAPVSRALAGVARIGALSRESLEQYLDARALDLDDAPFADEAQMDVHALAVGGGIVRLAARVLGVGPRADEAADLAGSAHVCAGHLRDLALTARHGRCRLPVSWLEEAGLNVEDLVAAQGTSPALRCVFARMSSKVRAALGRLNCARFPRAATAALAVATLARPVTAAGFDPIKADTPAPARQFARLALANLLWRF